MHTQGTTAHASKFTFGVFETTVTQRRSHYQAELEGTLHTVKQNLKAELQNLQKASGSMSICAGLRVQNQHKCCTATRAPSGRT